MSSLDEIKAGLENIGLPMPEVINQDPTSPMPMQEADPHLAMKQELLDLRISIESILIWLKITNRLSEAQYRFIFGHVGDTIRRDDEGLNEFLTRSAITLEKKMKDAGLI